MSQENVEIVVGQFENANARDFKAVMDAYADDVVLVLHGDLRSINGEGATGEDAVGEWFGDWFSTFESDYHLEVEETRDQGDRVLVVATHHVRGRASGAAVSRRTAWVYTVSDEKVVHCDAYFDPAEALEAAGLRE